MGRACATMTAIPVVVGPTGIGKSQLAFELALRLDGEIVVADSRQVYQRLDIATNKPSDEQRRRVRYHMIDFVDPASDFNAAQYVVGARAAIDDITSRGKLPIVEGGTMLYVDAVCDGFSLTGIPPNPALRSELARLDVRSLRERLLGIDPEPGVDLKNPVRMIRAVEPPLRAPAAAMVASRRARALVRDRARSARRYPQLRGEPSGPSGPQPLRPSAPPALRATSP